MINPNASNHSINNKEEMVSEEVNEWDRLKEVPFAGEKQPAHSIKNELREKLTDFQRLHRDRQLTAQSFIFHLLDTLHPILSSNNSTDIYDDYDFWRDALRELEPILQGFWPECDPIIIGYLFSLFVVEIMLLLRFWHATGCTEFCIKDCAILGETYFGIGLIQKSTLTSLADHWNILDEGRPDYLAE